MGHAIETSGLTKKFDDLVAVDNLNIHVKEGEVFGLLGPNGAGKTTTISMLATLIRPTSGTAYVDGHDILKEPEKVRASIGIVFQDPSSDDILTGRENLYLHTLMYGVPKADRERRIEEVLELVDLTDRADDIVKKYSGGMRRRLELARGLSHDPGILFLDEPTLGLDPQTREHIWEYIDRLVSEEGVSIILTTHYMEEADRLCDRVGIIDFGRIAVLDEPAELKKRLGGDILRLAIEEPDMERVEALPFVGMAEYADGVLSLRLEDAAYHLQEILGLVGKVESVELRTPTLNDVFLHHTGKDIRDEGALSRFQVFNRARSKR